MSSKLRTNQRKAIESLLSGLNKQQAAAAAGVHPATVSRWLAEPDFKAELSAGSDSAMRAASVRFTGSIETAGDVMNDILLNSDDDTARLRAADMVVSYATKLNELKNLLERVEALEQAQNDTKNTR